MAEPVEAGLRRREVVTAFLRRAGRILLVRRSARVGSYRGRWSGISGYLEESTPLGQALREIREETDVSEADVTLIKAGEPMEIPAPELGVLWVVHPFLFELVGGTEIRLDWENSEQAWVEPHDLANMETVPRLREALMACMESDSA